MYGPPPDPMQQLAPTAFAEAPLPYLACLFVGLLLAFFARPQRPFLFITGVVIALTTPLTWYVPTYVFGDFPTIDKAGSLLFYLDGVHTRLFSPDDPALRLIGVHMGHLWVTAFFDLFLASFAAFNAQGLLNLVLSCYCAFRLLRLLCDDAHVALLLCFCFGLSLHQFRDLNWYTIEKSSLFCLALYAEALLRVHRGQRSWAPIAALIYVLSFFHNVYWGVLEAGLGALALLLSRTPRMLAAVAGSAIAALPLVYLQLRLMHGEGALGDPETFLTERAALDIVELWPPRWNRLEGWRAVNVLVLGLAAWGAWRQRVGWLWLLILPFFILSLGPTHNPVYMLLFEIAPGFWRVAKPETFFHYVYLGILAQAAITLTALRPQRRALLGLAALLLLGWLWGVRSHPVYPTFTQPIPLEMGSQWRR